MYMHDELWVAPAAGGAAHSLTGKLDRWISSYKFLADNKSVSLLIEDDGNTIRPAWTSPPRPWRS